MTKLQTSSYSLISFFLVLPFQASAHTGGEALHGFSDGFMHPWQGFDHLLAMTAIGLWAVFAGGRSLWLLPCTFLTAMAGGALLNRVGMTLYGAELWVAFSVCALGLILAFGRHLSMSSAAGWVALFAMGHGYVHAAEIGNDANPQAYALGFLMATALLHGIGMASGLAGPIVLKAVRTVFAVICTLAGAALLVGV